jgi:CheY-like chemotaxis protein
MLAVSDTGLGMDANTQLHAFEPFFTTKELGKGTGLGLSTVYGIVKQSGGFIWLYSELNVGTTFKIYLPALTELSFDQDEATSFEAPDTTETGTVLLVEDDPLVRNVALRALETAGYRVLESGNGHGALAMAHSCDDDIDLVITDVVMPLMGGRELAQELSALHPKTSILFMESWTRTSNTCKNHLRLRVWCEESARSCGMQKRAQVEAVDLWGRLLPACEGG